MSTFWTTLLEINLILSITYLGYRMLLGNLTFFRWTRAYLLGGMLLGLVYPLLKIKQVIQTPAEGVNIVLPNISQGTQVQNFDYNQWAIYAVIAVFILLLLKFLLRFFSLGRIHFASDHAEFNGQEFRNTHSRVNPFSFWKWIYIHRDSHSDFEMRQIVTHEHIHTRERHTLDVLIAEICTIICWYNPLVRLLAKSVKDNLEFLVDAEVLYSGIDKISYQHSLVGISLSGFPQPSHGNQFVFKTLKKRIQMMNKDQSPKFRLASYLLLTPLVLGSAALLTFSCQKETLDNLKSAENITLTKKAKVEFGELKIGDIPDTSGKSEKIVFERTVSAEVNESGTTPEERVTHVEIDVVPEDEKPVIKLQEDNMTISNPNIIALNKPSLARSSGLSLSKEKPLILVDGKEILSIHDIKVEDIEAISVFKDKSAKALYGERAENGLILITTKTGHKGSRQ